MRKKRILWAPWRAKYVTNSDGNSSCIFCEKSQKGNDAENLVIHRGERVFAMLNLYPYNNGHVMVSPYRHTGDLEALSGEELCEMMDTVKLVTGRIKKKMNPHGFNIGMNIGRPAGAGFDKHLHMHIVPRWSGDTNFMPVLFEDKVISESLESVYGKLKT